MEEAGICAALAPPLELRHLSSSSPTCGLAVGCIFTFIVSLGLGLNHPLAALGPACCWQTNQVVQFLVRNLLSCLCLYLGLCL